ncbi:hypothetical protein Pmani_008583 [Petrolisthes manimaculis]|uniref:Uncharacterized protein n=1 Tax=Petrolisthes manimaculis TaxID=1843537 RepID=A0AAE1Q6G5_9EUCA|nr:hypothetical protein Pmani_008583 [Petrolisthes manimaculis]
MKNQAEEGLSLENDIQSCTPTINADTMTIRRMAFLLVVVMVVGVLVEGMGVMVNDSDVFDGETREEEVVGVSLDINESGNSIFSGMRDDTSVGNIVYSGVGLVLGGLFLFVTLFDPTRREVINTFNTLFGHRDRRRRREATVGLEERVAQVFNTFTSALDKMEVVSKLANK